MDILGFLREYQMIIMLVLMMGLRAYMRRRRANGAPEETYDSNVVEVRSPKQMLQLIKLAQADDQLLVVDYYTTWCGPCKKAAPVIAEMSRQFLSVVWCKIDCDKQRELAKGINSFPTFIVFKNGKPVYRQNGFSKESILAALQKQGADLSAKEQERIRIQRQKQSAKQESSNEKHPQAETVGAPSKAEEAKETDINDID